MGVAGYRDEPTTPWNPDAAVDVGQAEDFLRLCHAENPNLGPLAPRLTVVREQIATTGTYEHTAAELAYGAKVA